MLERSTYHVYMVTGASLSRVLYIGVTSDLVARIDAHRRRAVDGFTARYRLWKLVYAEAFVHVRDHDGGEPEHVHSRHRGEQPDQDQWLGMPPQLIASGHPEATPLALADGGRSRPAGS